MWNAMFPALGSGARVICYDGSPFHPDLRTFMKFISDQGCVSETEYVLLNSNAFRQGHHLGNVAAVPHRASSIRNRPP